MRSPTVPRGVLLTTTGIACALVLWVTATAIGVAALLNASSTLFNLLKVVGGTYLAYLGIRAWLASRALPGDLLAREPAAPAGAILRQGQISAATNPKLGVLFVSLLPQFIDPHRPPQPQQLLLGAIFAAIGWAWMNVYGLLVAVLRGLILTAKVRRWMERVTGTVLIGLGARLVFDRS